MHYETLVLPTIITLGEACYDFQANSKTAWASEDSESGMGFVQGKLVTVGAYRLTRKVIPSRFLCSCNANVRQLYNNCLIETGNALKELTELLSLLCLVLLP